MLMLQRHPWLELVRDDWEPLHMTIGNRYTWQLGTVRHDNWEPLHMTIGNRYNWQLGTVAHDNWEPLRMTIGNRSSFTAQSHLLPSKIKSVQGAPKEVITSKISINFVIYNLTAVRILIVIKNITKKQTIFSKLWYLTSTYYITSCYSRVLAPRPRQFALVKDP